MEWPFPVWLIRFTLVSFRHVSLDFSQYFVVFVFRVVAYRQCIPWMD